MDAFITSPATFDPVSAPAEVRPATVSRLGFFLFLILNGVMFLRPPELIPQLAGLPIYEAVILLCTACSLPKMLDTCRPSRLLRDPITLCVFGMGLAVIASLVARGDTWNARERGLEFAKIAVYYLLLVSLVDSPQRLRTFLYVLFAFTLALSAIALLSYHDVIHLSTVSPYAEGQAQIDPDTGERVVVVRLQAMGVYGNPNALARIVAVGITVGLLLLARTRSMIRRLICLGPLLVLGHAIQLTYSRGGLLGLIAGLVVLFHARFGMRKGGAAILLMLPLLAIFSGRQTDIDTSSGTGQLRIQLWSNGLVALRSTPLFGIGAGYYPRVAGNDAHNSFIEAFVDMGVIGGTIFTSAFAMAIAGLYHPQSKIVAAFDPELAQLRPFILSIVVGTVVGQFSASRAYFPPTYMILGLATCYLAIVQRHRAIDLLRVTPRLIVRCVLVGLCTLVFLHLYTKFNARF